MYLDNTLLWQCLVLFWKKGKNAINPKASRWKSESTSENPSWFWKKTTWGTCSGTIVSPASFSHVKPWIWKKASSRKYSQQETKKIKTLRFLSSSNFKVQFVWRFYFSSKHGTHLEHTHKVLPDTASLLYTHHELATGLGTRVTAIKKAISPKAIFFKS